MIAILISMLEFNYISILSTFCMMIATLLVKFAVFNILPIYPLFGQKLFQTILPANKALVLSQYEKIIQVLIILLVLMGYLQKVLDIVSNAILSGIGNIVILLLGF